ncbi:ABC transporter G family member 11 [Rhizoctonia solani]|uniref:ABC transporter G family member 11 n=1 Tax=Rhizoctonia solani TaxID=456999 RepID=A0A8H8T2Z5_9AGAM|nr:ABC transporter G family member 11 [Rhizoctonia solani]QRW26814.1 ABC transporter G family member 11 [Rhizoctonia solani]
MSRYNSGIASDPATAVPSRAPSETIDMQDTEKHQHQNTGINVHNAEKQFNDLARRLTRQSTHHDEKGASDPDIENQQSFDLLEYLRSTSGKQNQAGFAHKHVGVTFHDLRVIGVGGVKIYVRTFPDAVKEFLLSPLYIAASLLGKKPSAPKTILHSFNGTVRPGEMVLVLGRPGSGCSSFLKTIANQRGSFLEVTGDVRYAGIGAQEFGKQFAGETVYNMEGKWDYDIHYPILTVAQTLQFALSLKSPGRRLPEQTRAQLNDEVLDMLLSMLNITHTRDTVVGNEFMRGVSGGERKRVSIAEMMATRACVLSWDNSTRGLDASTALDYAKSLRIMTDIFKLTTFVSLYQAGEGIYDQFDKVLLIDEGRQVYFGPAKEARDYMLSLGFRNLPRQTTADYLTGCTDPNERAFAEGRSEVDVPSTPDQLAEAFERSKYWSQMVAEREAVEEEWRREENEASGARGQFLQATKEEKRKHVSRKDPHVVTFLSMVKTLVWRQWLMQIQDTFSIFTSFATAIIISILSGTVYLNLPLTSAGAFTRGGVIFLALLFNALNAFSELPAMMTGRPILYKQLSYRFYRASALSVAQTITDIPLTAIRILIFSIIIYFMCGLQRSAGAFFTFYLFIYITFLAMAAFFRLIGIICQGYDMAARLAASIVTLMVVYSGYMIPVYAMKRWLFWIWYLNPVNYGFAAMMENEFYRIDMNCDGNYIIPHNVGDITKYPTTLGPNQVCTLLGASPGQSQVSGDAYIAAGFEYQKAHIWRNLGIVLLYWFGFIVLQILAMEKFQHGANAVAITIYAKETKETKELNMRLKERKASARKGQDDQNVVVTKSTKAFTWENLDYTVPVPGGTRQLLNKVFGYVKPGTLTALMGASGAGKTTLLDVLAGRKTIGVIHGDVLIGGERTGIAFQRGTAYCEQLDVHESTATVREALRFSAYLRQPYDVSKEEKDTYVEEVIALLEMEDIADAMIGQPGVGLGVEARKRVTIGVELAAKPQLLLFLDEPTSGLDGQSAYNIVRFLKKLAAGGQAILCTIHQPNALLFEQFDNLLLLQRGGECVYFGPIGKDSQHLFMLEAIGAGSRERIGPTDWAELWRQSENFARVKEEIAEIKEDAARQVAVVDPNANKKYATPFMYQLRVVSERTLTAFWRQPDYGFTRLFTHGVIALITSLTFLQLGNSTQELQYRVFSIFIATIMPAIIISQVEPMFIIARMIFIRESSSRMYSEFAFALASLWLKCPTLVYFLLFYYPTGFQYASDRAGYQFLMFLVTEVFAVTLGQMIAALTPTVFIAGLLNPFILVTFSLFCGVMIPKDSIPKFWRVWLYQLDPFTRLISGMVSTELHGLKITCSPLEFAVFQPPQGQTCLQWAGDFVNASVGYLDNPGSTSDCRYCPYEYGDDFYSGLGISFDTRWRDFGILIAFTVFNTIVTLIASRVFKFSKR